MVDGRVARIVAPMLSMRKVKPDTCMPSVSHDRVGFQCRTQLSCLWGPEIGPLGDITENEQHVGPRACNSVVVAHSFKEAQHNGEHACSAAIWLIFCTTHGTCKYKCTWDSGIR